MIRFPGNNIRVERQDVTTLTLDLNDPRQPIQTCTLAQLFAFVAQAKQRNFDGLLKVQIGQGAIEVSKTIGGDPG